MNTCLACLSPAASGWCLIKFEHEVDRLSYSGPNLLLGEMAKPVPREKSLA
jgi:hypothetical protein